MTIRRLLSRALVCALPLALVACATQTPPPPTPQPQTPEATEPAPAPTPPPTSTAEPIEQARAEFIRTTSARYEVEPATIESVLAQTHEAVEVIVVDDQDALSVPVIQIVGRLV